MNMTVATSATLLGARHPALELPPALARGAEPSPAVNAKPLREAARAESAWPQRGLHQRPGALAVVVGVHVLALLGLTQALAPRLFKEAPKPIEVSLIESPEQARKPEPPVVLNVAPQAPTLPRPLDVPLVAIAAPPVEHAPIVAVAPPPNPTPVQEAAPTVVAEPPPPQPPRMISASALRYRVEPPVAVPALSRRAGESGMVVVRVVVDTQGLPKEVSLHRSSGFARLDAQALWAMRQARFEPYRDQGRPLEVAALAPIAYELES
ncbi:energy transducer TonB [Roseateles sp. BYS180W]|uniref:Energy transducer TonB n=1 Tax=Roseateles rivi TaxID=3299028 RepID=A0ABW7FT21_9BURK